MGGSGSKIAGGNISPSRFVKLDTANEGRVLQCVAGDQPWGISQPSTRRAALAGWDDGFAAVLGENVNVILPEDDVGLLEAGGTVAVGDRLEPDAIGRGTATNAVGDHIGAIALTAGVVGDLIRVKPVRYQRAA